MEQMSEKFILKKKLNNENSSETKQKLASSKYEKNIN